MIELALEVVRAELAEVRLVPYDDVRLADVVEAGPAREEGVDDRRDVLEVLEEELALGAHSRYGAGGRKGGTDNGQWLVRGHGQRRGRTTVVGGGGGGLRGRPLPMGPLAAFILE